MNKYDFVLSVCAFEGVSGGTMMCIEKLHQETDYHFKVEIQGRSCAIGRARSLACSNFLKAADSDLLIFVDADIIFAPDDIAKLVEAVKEGYDVIAGAYFLSDLAAFAIRPWGEVAYQPDGLIHDVEYVSTGFMAISRRGLERVRDKLKLPLLHPGHERECYPFFESGRDRTGRHDFYLSEDWDFCDKVRGAEMDTYWHSGIVVGHFKKVLLCHKDGLDSGEHRN